MEVEVIAQMRVPGKTVQSNEGCELSTNPDHKARKSVNLWRTKEECH